MLPLAIILFAAAVLTVLFWTAVGAAALAVIAALLFVLQAAWWLITRPVVWFIIRPIQFIFANRETETPKQASPAACDGKNANDVPHSALIPVKNKVDQLAKIRALWDDGTITHDEFNRMKGEILSS